jgi:uncharacterized protein YprB with RNaseH-like and TPR domain
LIQSTFKHIQGIGTIRERAIWRAGGTSWKYVIEHPELLEKVLSAGLSGQILEEIQNDYDSLHGCEASFLASRFVRRLKRSEHWRLYERFAGEATFLDIETTGLNRRLDRVTVIGTWSMGAGARVFVRGFNLDQFQEFASGMRLVVTFNGNSFDLPFLEQAMPGLRLPRARIDLRWLAKQIGLAGGLKRIEAGLGVERADDLAQVDGLEAIRLWRSWSTSADRVALIRLIRYNLADTVNLRRVAVACVNRAVAKAMAECGEIDSTQLSDPGPWDFEAGTERIISDLGL